MTSFHNVLVSSGLVLAFFSGPVEAQQNIRAAGKMVTLQMPAIPDPARVTLDPKTTALIVLDYVEPICSAQPSCKDKMLPAMTPFMELVRKAGLTVAYGTREQNMSKWLKEVAPTPSDIGFYNVLNSGNANLANESLKPKATTLSRTDMITFQ